MFFLLDFLYLKKVFFFAHFLAMETGWTFGCIGQMDIRHARPIQNNVIMQQQQQQPHGFYGRGKALSNVQRFHEDLRRIVLHNIMDPASLIPPNCIGHDNLCMILNILIQIDDLFSPASIGRKRKNLRFDFFLRLLPLLSFDNLLTPYGVCLSDLPKLERQNSPIGQELKKKYPGLGHFKGISINIFRLCRNVVNGKWRYYLFPLTLSQNYKNYNEFLQIDLLRDNEHLRPSELQSLYANDDEDVNAASHCLLIRDICRLVISFQSTIRGRHHSHRFRYLCRACIRLFQSEQVFKVHLELCSVKGGGGQKRLNRNQLVHVPFTQLTSGKTVRNSVMFQRRNLYKKLKPFILTTFDIEATNEELTADYEEAPKNASLQQRILAYCFQHGSTYDGIELPANLSSVRVQFLDDRSPRNTRSQFYLQMLIRLRDDLLLIHRHFVQLLRLDVGLTPFLQLSLEHRIQFLMETNCQLCGKPFGSYKDKGKRKTRTKHRDHDHIERGTQTSVHLGMSTPPSTDRFISCNLCNLSLRLSLMSQRQPLRVWTHNSERYDSNFICKALFSVNQKYFYQLNKDGVLEKTSFLASKPSIVYRTESTPLSIKFRFSCPEKATCERHSLSKTDREYYVKKYGRALICPYSRPVEFLDSYNHIAFPLDTIVRDLNECSIVQNIPLNEIFKNTYRMVQNEGYSEGDFNFLVSQKMKMPFERVSGFRYLIETKDVPPKSHFRSRLNFNDEPISTSEYDTFCEAWRKLRINNLYELFNIYLKLDTNFLLDSMLFHFQRTFNSLGFYAR